MKDVAGSGFPRPRGVVLSMFDAPGAPERARQVEAAAYPRKTAPSEELLVAIRGRRSDGARNAQAD